MNALFSAKVFGAERARALDALAALEACVSADLLRGRAVAPESVPFARPTGASLYEADALTWRLYHTQAGCVAHAINNAAYGDALARALYARLILQTSSEEEEDTVNIIRPTSVDDVRAALAALRRALRALGEK